MASATVTQDLPPKGGFGQIQYEKIPHKQFFNGKRIALVCLASYTIGYLGYRESMKMVKAAKIETQSAHNAIQPFLLSERDRQLLKQMKKNRAVETELMKDVKGWEVGTLFGTPVYNTVGENEWIGYDPLSYYAHADPEERLFYEAYNFFT